MTDPSPPPDPHSIPALGPSGQPSAHGGFPQLNPFGADVCPDPLRVSEKHSVAGMNRDVVARIAEAIDERRRHAGEMTGQPLMLLTAPRAGYGKTHLLGRVAAATGTQVALVPLAFRIEDHIGWPAVGLRTTEALSRAGGDRSGWTRLRESAAGVCSALLLRLIQAGRLPCANSDQAVRVLTTDPTEIFAEQGSAKLIGDWLRKHFNQLRRPLADAAVEAMGGAFAQDIEKWVQTMLAVAAQGDGRSVETLRAAVAEPGGCEFWLRMLAIWRPVVLLVDHLDGFYRNEQAGLRIAMLLLDLTEIEGVHVVLSLNQDVWQATFGHHLPSALEDRLTASQVLLRGLTADEAVSLVKLRLQEAGIDADEAGRFERFLDVRRYFMGRPLGSVSARAFLRHAALQWTVFRHSPESGEAMVGDEAAEESILPVIEERPRPPAPESPRPAPGEVRVFDRETGDYLKRVAEGLAEPVAALPQQGQPPLPPPTAPPVEPPPVAEGEPARPDLSAPADAAMASMPTLGTSASARSASAFEKLREMLDRLRSAEGTKEPQPNGSHGESAGVTPGDASADAAAARDALLGRFEALRLQMAAEAQSRPLDHARLSELVRLAGKRFPLVHFNEVELPGLTGRTAVKWQLQGLEILFGLGDFGDRRYWQTLALYAAGRQAELIETAVRTGEPAPALKIAAFKSDRDADAWDELHREGVFPAVLRENIDAVHLDTRSIASLYAMQRMIKEAQAGTIKAEPAQVISVLARELDFFWKRVTRPLMTTK